MMGISFKPLIAVLAIGAAVFWFAKPIALLFSAPADFARRRNIWFALTITAFLSPSFWLFALVAIPVLYSAAHKDTNPVALYLLLLHVIPPTPVFVRMPGMSYLFEIDNHLLLSFCLLIPAVILLRKDPSANRMRGLQAMDLLLLAYGVLEVVLFVHPDLPGHLVIGDSFTNFLRRVFLFITGVYIPYYALSRSCSTRRRLVECQAAFVLSCALLAATGIFESVRHWLLYVDLPVRWGSDLNAGFYLTRGDSVRAQVSAGHSLALGYVLAIGLGFWMYLQSHVASRTVRLGVTLLLWLGLIAAYSRGPWVGAVVIYVAYAGLNQSALRRLVKMAGAAVLVAGAISLSPLRQKIVSVLPFMGGAIDNANLTYRRRLFDRCWDIVMQSPFFGDQFAATKLEDLRQGEGIIDMVNTYLQVSVDTGLVGLALFLGFMLTGLGKVYALSRSFFTTDLDFAMLGVSIMSCILGTLLMIENASFAAGYEWMFYILAAMAAAYAHVGGSPKRALPEMAPA